MDERQREQQSHLTGSSLNICFLINGDGVHMNDKKKLNAVQNDGDIIREVSGHTHTFSCREKNTTLGFPLGGVVKTVGCRYGNTPATGGE